jgi:outer membrane protein assembly factor BamB
MKLSLRSLPLALVLVVAGLATAGCAGGADDVPTTNADDLTAVKQGFTDVSSEWGGEKAIALAVAGGKAYVGFGERGFAILDARTWKTTKRVARDDAGRFLPADSVQIVGDDLMVAGLRNDAPIDPFQGGSSYRYVVSIVDRTSGAVKKDVTIDVMPVLSKAGESFFDLPNMSSTIDHGKVWLVISHARAKKLVGFDLPAARSTTLDLKALLAGPTFAVDLAKDVAVHDGAAWLPVPDGRSSGFVKRIDLQTGATSKVGAELGYPVAVAFGTRAMFVANHEGALLAVDPVTGATLKSIAVPDFVTGVTSDANNVYVSTWKGLFVVRNEWN